MNNYFCHNWVRAICLYWTRPLGWRHAFFRFPTELTNKLNEHGFTHLHHIWKRNSTLLTQFWSSDVELDLSVDESWIWERYINILRNNLVYLNNKLDVLKWTKNVKGGVYIPKLGYLAIRTEEEIDPAWWCHTIWKINCPLKIQLFLWRLMEGKVLIWNTLVHRFYTGPSRCPLWKIC